MQDSLAVFSNDLGASFIDFHVSALAPGRTVAVGRYGAAELGNLWAASCPTLLLDEWALRLPVRLAVRAGISMRRQRSRAVADFLRRHRVRVVLGEYLDDFLEFVPLMERMGLPYVVQGHGVDVSAAIRRPGMAERYLAYRSARAVLTRSEFHRHRLIGLGLPESIVHVNRGGVHVPGAPPARPACASKRLLAIGRLVPKKGPFYLFESFRRAAASDAQLTLDYVGGGPLLWVARQFAEAAGLQDRIRWHGGLSEDAKVALLVECGVFVQHSVVDEATGDEEGLPASIQEAMAYGMAVVATRHAGIPEAVHHGTTGLLVEERDVDGMAEALLAVQDTAVEMGLAGHAEAVKHHDWRHEERRLRNWLVESTASQ